MRTELNAFRYFIIISLSFLTSTFTGFAQHVAFEGNNNTLALTSFAMISNFEWDKTNANSYPGGLKTDGRSHNNTKADIHFIDTITHKLIPSFLASDLVGFNSIASHNNIYLQWKASYLQNVQELMVEQSADGISFQEVSYMKVNPSEKVNGIMLSQEDGLFFYRLKMLDNNGATGYTEVLACKTNTEATGIVSVFPNSISDEWLTALSIATNYRGKIKVVISDDHGQQLIEFHREIITEKTKIPIGIATIPKGSYSIFVSKSDGSHIGSTQEIVKL